MPLFVGTDIGGTFTDLVGFDLERGRLFFGKTLTNYRDLVEGVVQCLRDVDLDPRAIAVLKHGTTQVINTLLERSGATMALVTTEGFADILEIGRAGRPLPFDLDYARNPPLVPRHLRLEVRERIDAAGRGPDRARRDPAGGADRAVGRRSTSRPWPSPSSTPTAIRRTSRGSRAIWRAPCRTFTSRPAPSCRASGSSSSGRRPRSPTPMSALAPPAISTGSRRAWPARASAGASS